MSNEQNFGESVDPVISPATVSSGMDPVVGDMTSSAPAAQALPQFTIKLLNSADEVECSFWVGLTRPGTLEPQKLLDSPGVSEVLDSAAVHGVTDSGAVMLSDTLRVPPRFVYMTPAPSDDFRARAIWVGDVISTIQAWGPRKIGFYLAPEIASTESANEMLLHVLRELMNDPKDFEFYLLQGKHSKNRLLNMALKLRAELDLDGVDLKVYH